MIQRHYAFHMHTLYGLFSPAADGLRRCRRYFADAATLSLFMRPLRHADDDYDYAVTPLRGRQLMLMITLRGQMADTIFQKADGCWLPAIR